MVQGDLGHCNINLDIIMSYFAVHIIYSSLCIYLLLMTLNAVEIYVYTIMKYNMHSKTEVYGSFS